MFENHRIIKVHSNPVCGKTKFPSCLHLLLLSMLTPCVKGFFSDTYVHYLNGSNCFTVYTCAKTDQIIYFKYVQFIACQLYCNKAAKFLRANYYMPPNILQPKMYIKSDQVSQSTNLYKNKGQKNMLNDTMSVHSAKSRLWEMLR